MNPISKAFMGIKSVCIYIKYKIFYGGRLKMNLINSIRRGLFIELFPKAECRIGKFLMSRGPLYIKCTDNAKIKIGKRCFFNHNCSITAAENITIGDNCMFANNLVIVDHDHKIEENGATGALTSQPIVIEDRVWCGANVTITKGVHIGEGAVIGANSVVTRDVEPYTVAAGVPARKIKSYNPQI